MFASVIMPKFANPNFVVIAIENSPRVSVSLRAVVFARQRDIESQLPSCGWLEFDGEYFWKPFAINDVFGFVFAASFANGS